MRPNRCSKVPNDPIIPFIEGDGTGPDIWAASQIALDGAVEKAYGGKRKISWLEVLAGEKAFRQTGEPHHVTSSTVTSCLSTMTSRHTNLKVNGCQKQPSMLIANTWSASRYVPSTFPGIASQPSLLQGPLTTPVSGGIRYHRRLFLYPAHANHWLQLFERCIAPGAGPVCLLASCYVLLRGTLSCQKARGCGHGTLLASQCQSRCPRWCCRSSSAKTRRISMLVSSLKQDQRRPLNSSSF